MDVSRRTLLLTAGSAIPLALLAACTEPQPTPTPTRTPTLRVPVPAGIQRSGWHADPFSRGAASFIPAGGLPELSAVAGASAIDRVFFAGEAFSSAPGTLRGAAESGEGAADAVRAASEYGERVAVIGAGLAGSRAAASLVRSGYDVIVIEARDRVGGRIESRTSDDRVREFGAWGLDTTLDEPLIRDLERDGLTLREATPVSYRGTDGDEPLEFPQGDDPAAASGQDAVDAALAWAASQSTDPGLLAALDESGALGAAADVDGLTGDALVAQRLELLAASSGGDAEVLSAWFPPAAAVPASIPEPAEDDELDEQPVTGTLLPDGPLSTLVERELEDIDVALSTAVVGIGYDEDGVSLRLSTGEALSVDRVIVTAPIGVLKADSIMFDPPLPPSQRAALNRMEMGDIEVVHVRFDEAFWEPGAVRWNLVGSELPFTNWIDLSPATGQPELMAVVGGSAARDLAELEDDQLTLLVRQSLEPFAAR